MPKRVARPTRRRKPLPAKTIFASKSATAKAVKGLQTRNKIAERLQRQKLARKEELQRKRAETAIKRFRPRKADRGQLVFVRTTGKRDDGKGRKGYIVQITKSGKKKLLKDVKAGFKPQTKTKYVLPYTRSTKNQVTKFQKGLIGKKPVIRGQGKITLGGSYEFSERLVAKFARSVTKIINNQRAFRNFILKGMCLIKLPDGTTKVKEVMINLQKQSVVKIPSEHLQNFLRKAFYAVLARQLAFDGYVTNGSANHVRRLPENEGKERDEWTKGGQAWESRHDTTQVTLSVIDWQLIQIN